MSVAEGEARHRAAAPCGAGARRPRPARRPGPPATRRRRRARRRGGPRAGRQPGLADEHDHVVRQADERLAAHALGLDGPLLAQLAHERLRRGLAEVDGPARAERPAPGPGREPGGAASGQPAALAVAHGAERRERARRMALDEAQRPAHRLELEHQAAVAARWSTSRAPTPSWRRRAAVAQGRDGVVGGLGALARGLVGLGQPGRLDVVRRPRPAGEQDGGGRGRRGHHPAGYGARRSPRGNRALHTLLTAPGMVEPVPTHRRTVGRHERIQPSAPGPPGGRGGRPGRGGRHDGRQLGVRCAAHGRRRGVPRLGRARGQRHVLRHAVRAVGHALQKARELGVRHLRLGVFSSDNAGWDARHAAGPAGGRGRRVRARPRREPRCAPDGTMPRCLARRASLPAGSVDGLRVAPRVRQHGGRQLGRAPERVGARAGRPRARRARGSRGVPSSARRCASSARRWCSATRALRWTGRTSTRTRAARARRRRSCARRSRACDRSPATSRSSPRTSASTPRWAPRPRAAGRRRAHRRRLHAAHGARALRRRDPATYLRELVDEANDPNTSA